MGHFVGEGPLLPQALPLLSASFFLAGGLGGWRKQASSVAASVMSQAAGPDAFPGV